MTAFSSVDTAVEAMRLGAFHYVTKPFDVDEIALLAKNALETIRLRREVRALRGVHQREYAFDAIIGKSGARRRSRELLGFDPLLGLANHGVDDPPEEPPLDAWVPARHLP